MTPNRPGRVSGAGWPPTVPKSVLLCHYSRRPAFAGMGSETESMLGLPLETLLLLLGVPAAWVAYTVVFLVLTRSWARDADASPED